MRFFAVITLLGLVLLMISLTTQNTKLGMIAFPMIVFGGFITLVLASKSSKQKEGDPSTIIEIHNHYDGNRKRKP